MASSSRLGMEEFLVGIICPLPIEMAAATAMLDEEYDDVDEQEFSDQNSYTFGRMGSHKVVIASLPAGQTGPSSAAAVAKDLLRSFKSLKFGLLVGIAGGSTEHDLRLGDVVISEPAGTYPAFLEFDATFNQTGHLNSPPSILLTALSKMKAELEFEESRIPTLLSAMIKKRHKMARDYSYQGREKDVLYQSSYHHQGDSNSCYACGSTNQVARRNRNTTDPFIHFGAIASSTTTIENAEIRDKLQQKFKALCFDTEAAGLRNFSCLVIRGISNYADSHKNRTWKRYAAAAAAAVAKDFLRHVPPRTVDRMQTIIQVSDPIQHEISLNSLEELRIQSRRLGKLYDRLTNDEILQCLQYFNVCRYQEYKEINPDRVDGTCLWTTQHPQFLKWANSKKQDLLWISADPGCGKSVLSRSLIHNELRGTDVHTVCYFFFKDNDDQRHLSACLCSILHQLFERRPKLLIHALEKWKSKKKTLREEPHELWGILMNASTDPEAKNLTCVLDALDECQRSDRNLLIQLLASFYRQSFGSDQTDFQLKFLATSRPYHEIEVEFYDIPLNLPTIRLSGENENQQIQEEISLVVKAMVSKLSRQLHLRTEESLLMEKKLLSTQDRTYLWLHLVMEELKSSLERGQELIETINHMPESVEGAYESLLNRYTQTSNYRSQAKAVLSIIVGARRPLTLKEMDVAFKLALKVKIQDLCLDERALKRKIRNLCGLFVFIHDDRIYLIHQTAREFLTKASMASSPNANSWRGSIRQLEYDLMLAEICILTILNQARERRAGLTTNFHRYSSLHWNYHYSSAKISESDRLTQEAYALYFGRELEAWSTTYLLKPLANTVEHASLLLAATAGNEMMVKLLLRNRTYSETERDAALISAAANGNKTVVELLLKTTADLRSSKAVALIRASTRGNEAIVRLLLENGADVRAREDAALNMACVNNHATIVELLVKGGADVDLARGDVLEDACWEGFEDVVRVLLVNGANPNPVSGRPLSSAASGGHISIAKLLLEHGADVNLADGSALRNASLRGDISMVKLLLESGADVNAGDGRPLMNARDEGHDDVCKLLLEHGATAKDEGRRRISFAKQYRNKWA